MKIKIDAIDWQILKELQSNGRMTNIELARRVGISAPPCLRRVRALEAEGIIEGYTALLNAKQLGYELAAFAMVSLQAQSEADLLEFEQQAAKWDVVRSCYMLSGEIDFMLACVAQDLASFQDFIIKELTATPNVAGVKTSLVIRQSKHVPGVPIS